VRLALPASLRDVAFRRFWLGRSLSLVGDQIRLLALPLTAVLVLHAGAGEMGIVGAVGALPALLFGVHAGAWLDRRGGRRQVMLWSDLGRAALLALVPALWAVHALTLAGLVAIQFLVGTLSVLFGAASGTVFVSLVPRDRYVEASALLSGSRAGAFVVGPGIAGALVQSLSAPLALLADGLSFVASALSLALVRPEEPAPAPAERGHLGEGLRFVRASPVLRASFLSAARLSLFRAAFMAVYLVYLTRSLHVTPAELGLILGPSSIGAVFAAGLAGAAVRRIGLGPTLVAGTILWSVPTLMVPLAAGSHATVVAVLFVAEGLLSAGSMVAEVAGGTLRAVAIPDALRSRVMGAMQLADRGLSPIGALLGGLVATWLGVRAAVWIGAVGISLAFAWLAFSPLARMRAVEAFAPPPGPSDAGAPAAGGV